jgi:hypothetical protein
MYYYRFEASGFASTCEFCIDDAAARRIGFEIAIEFTRYVGHVVFIDISDAAGNFVARVPRLPGQETAPAARI